LKRAPRIRANPTVEGHLPLAGAAGEGLELQEIAFLRPQIDRTGEPEVELPIGVDDPFPRKPRLLAHRPQRRAPPVPTPVLVQKLSHDERILTELELGHTLSHDASLVDPGFDLARAREGRARGCRRFPHRGGWLA